MFMVPCIIIHSVGYLKEKVDVLRLILILPICHIYSSTARE